MRLLDWLSDWIYERRLAFGRWRIGLVYPDWVETVRSPEFDAWLDTQPSSIHKLCASPRGKDAIAVLDAFKAR